MVIDKIREATLKYHDDFTGWARNIFNGSISMEQYKTVLKTFYGFYKPFEEKLEKVEGINELGLDLENRRKINYLLEDMKSLGITETEINEIKMAKDDDLPPLNNLANALGSMYVIEGATLGGKMVGAQLKDIFSFNGNGTGFFLSYGEQVKPRWAKFIEIINKYAQETNTDGQIVDASHAAYFKFNDWLAGLRE